MKKIWLLFFISCAACGLAADAPPNRKPLFPATITCFIGEIDSRSSCSGELTTVQPNGLTCGSQGKVSALHWEFVGSEGKVDIYRVDRRFPLNAPDMKFEQKTVRFDGTRAVVFKDAFHVIVIERAREKK